MENNDLAEALERMAELLRAQNANPFRARAWLEGARAVRELGRPATELLTEGGTEALEAVPRIGARLAGAIAELVGTGRLRALERAEGEASAEHLFVTVPGIGPELARRVHERLGVETLEELEVAAHDGRLEQVPGFGPRRAELVREALETILKHASRRRAHRYRGATAAPAGRIEPPPVEVILSVDAEYRKKAGRGELRRIAPRRFNPDGEAWLPILHTERDPWHFTALFSNSARAHELDKTHDWVVIFWEREGHEGQCTVVTETRGPQVGQRVVRGRESERDPRQLELF